MTCQSDYAHVWRHLLDVGPMAVVAVLRLMSPGSTALKTDNPFSLISDLIGEEQRIRLVERAHNPMPL